MHRFLQNDFLESYDKLLRNSLCKVTNVKMDDKQFLQAVRPAAKGGLGVSSARLLALPAFLASAVGAKDALSENFGSEHVDGTYDDVLKRWFDFGKIEMAPENEIQTNWTEPIFDSEIADLILRLEPTDVKILDTFQYRFGSSSTDLAPEMVERHSVQTFKVNTVEPTTQNCDRTSIRLQNMRTA